MFRGKRLGNGAGIISGGRALVSYGFSPEEGLAVEVSEIGEVTGVEEGVAHVLDSSFDSSLLIAASRAARSRLKVIMSAEFEQARVEVNSVSIALEDHRLKIIEKDSSWDPAPVSESMDMAEKEVLQGLVEEELEVESSRVGKSENKGGETPRGFSYLDLAEVCPVCLCLLAG